MELNRNPYFESVETTTSTGTNLPEDVNPILVPGLTSIIIAVHNINYALFHYTGNCIGSVREHTTLPYEIILVDNASPVKPGKLSEYNVDKVVVNEENKGVAYAWNQGIRVSSGEYICLLNNDSMVFDNWLEDLQEALQHVDLIRAHPMYGEPYSRGFEANQKRALWANRPITESFTDLADFSCVLTKKELFNKIGLFDEQFFMYLEDLDFLKRMEKEGLRYATTKKVNTFHIIGGTSTGYPGTAEIMNESREKYRVKWEQ